VSDGAETLGRAAEWAAGARERGVTIDVLQPAGLSRTDDLRLSDVRVPESLWQGDDVEVEAVVASEGAGRATARLQVDGRPAGEQAVELRPGANTLRFVLRPLSPGYHALRVEVVPQGQAADPVAENNALAATTVVRDKPRVLVLEGERNAGDRLRRALERGGSDVTVRDPGSLTARLSDLAPYDAVVLVDVPAGRLSFDRQKALQEYVRSLGKGLVVTGGINSFGRGAYEGSTLEETLPVRVKPRDEGKRPPVALLLIVDTSYSMDAPRGGPTRIEMAKTAAAGAVRALSPGDEVAILAFSDNNNWVTRLRTINNTGDIGQITDAIGRLKPDGTTEMYAALRAGIDELGKSSAGTKHIVLLSDGSPSTPFDDRELAGRVRQAGMTLSSIAIGEGAAVDLMERLAKGGNGRYSFARRPEDIPRLTLEEAEQLGGKTLATGDFRAVQVAPSSILRGLDPARLPTLGGYGITEIKPDAQLVLASGKNEPVLAQWQYGLGRVVAWTSDVSQELAPNWRDADAYAPFWNGAVRWTLPAAGSPAFRVRATPDGRDVIVSVDAFDADGAAVNLAETRATLRTPDGASVAIALPQSGPGRYEARLADPAPGAYRLELRQSRGGSPIADVAGFRVPYPAELRGPGAGAALLGALTDRTGGRLITDPAALFDARTEARALRFQAVWPSFVALGLGLFLLDIALRLRHTATPATGLRRLLPR
ncbi:MAG: VWA domain-containing protein, partial [Chloroflexota bacterium]|nr:VWA domain-containing protein [Chloroflexota bacterium]